MDEAFYRAAYGCLLSGETPTRHYDRVGRDMGLMPDPDYDPLTAKLAYPDLSDAAREAALREDGLNARLDHMVGDVLERLDRSDAFFWRYRDTQLYDDPARRTAAHRQHQAEIDQPGEIPFRAGDKSFTILKRGPEELADLIGSVVPFLRPRIPHGFLDMMGRLQEILPVIQSLWGPLDEASARRLAVRLLRRIFPKNPMLCENFIEELLAEITASRGRADICLAFKAHPEIPDGLFGTCDPDPHRYAAATKLIADLFPDGYAFEDGIAWKRYVATGAIARILPEIRQRRVVLIANTGFAELGARWDLPDFHHLAIPPRDSHLDRYRILDALADGLRPLIAEHPSPLVMTQAGGSFSFWVLTRLQRAFPTASFLDIGQAINPWFLDDPATGKPEMLWLQDYWEDIFAANEFGAFYAALLGRPDAVDWCRETYFNGAYLKSLPDFSGDHDFARLLMRYGRFTPAVAFAERAAASAPHSAIAQTTLGQLRRRFGQPDEALRLADAAIARNPALKMAHLLRCMALYDLGEYAIFLDEIAALELDEAQMPKELMAQARAKLQAQAASASEF